MTNEQLEKRASDLRLSKQAIDAGQPDLGYQLAVKWAEVNVNDAEALYCVAAAAELSAKHAIAYQFAKRATELRPDKWAAWLLLGTVCMKLWLYDESERASRRAIKQALKEKDRAATLANLATLYIRHGEFAKARPFLEESVKLDPTSRMARANLGMCLLSAREWDPGWQMYHECLGSPQRKRIAYGSEPEWDGTEGLKVVLYGEQGIGDEISFASMVPDAIKHCDQVIIYADPRLTGLFKRSFPAAHVYGSRKQSHLAWDPEDQAFHASAPFGKLGGFYRLKEEDFPGTAYLVPDPERVLMWKALWETKKDPMTGQNKPVIGIAWTGGVEWNAERFRQWTLEDITPILEAIPAHWVSLQYKDASKEIARYCEAHTTVDLNQYSFGTLTNDYDDTAALVASCDHVIAMQTAVVHLAGALGVSCDVFVPRTSQWRYGEGWTSLPWYKSVNVIRQAVRGHWSNTIREYADGLDRTAVAA